MKLTHLTLAAQLAFTVFSIGLSGCATDSATKPTEALDEKTGLTVGSMQSPIELVLDSPHAPPTTERRTSFAYLGPVEWDRMGTITYGLWLHIAPGNDQQVVSVRERGAASLMLDDGVMDLTPMESPGMGREPYKAVVSWGQTVYFTLSAEDLKRMAQSADLKLGVRGQDGSTVVFLPTRPTHATLTRFAISRGIIAD